MRTFLDRFAGAAELILTVCLTIGILCFSALAFVCTSIAVIKLLKGGM
jgi:hypothetical protein